MRNSQFRKPSVNSAPIAPTVIQRQSIFALSESKLRDLDTLTDTGFDVLVKVVGRITILGIFLYGLAALALRYLFK
jgi:hypothetical protein